MFASTGKMEKRLLLVDDDHLIRENLSRLLRASGYHVTVAADGEEALHCLYDGERPDLILLDLRMPVLNGWEFRHLQQQDPQLCDIPVVIMTAEANAPSLGAVDYLQKPFDVNHLLTVVERHCRPQPRSKAAGRVALAFQ